ncbi:glycosyltransferase family 2 protein [Mangrovitalea sediminis]|uniref:glycosyltransferase family 2 protein n=1 Tax=Mangrovitalea sediminis TaxID=1982043 RepID=UPI000BE590D7|nr:glycosyltransferase family 2 protein [Mangrovitalea sediminis]
MKQPLTACIITLNEAERLSACLASLEFVDEIVIVDSGSTDDTVALAESHGARVIQQPWLGYGRQKQFAVDQASHDWVLCLDADERLTPELALEIQSAMQSPDADAYEMPRCNLFLGRWLRHGEGYPDLSLRLFHRQKARWSEDPVHEKVVCSGSVGRFKNDLNHQSADRIERYLQKQNRYTSLQAEALHARDKKPSAFRMLSSPVTRFFKFYIVRRGFLDGIPGLIHILIGCMNSFFKYAKLYELHASDAFKEQRRSE